MHNYQGQHKSKCMTVMSYRHYQDLDAGSVYITACWHIFFFQRRSKYVAGWSQIIDYSKQFAKQVMKFVRYPMTKVDKESLAGLGLDLQFALRAPVFDRLLKIC